MVDPSRWLDLADIGARRARVPEHLREDAAAEAALSFAKKPPRNEPEAIAIATYRAIDYWRKWSGGKKPEQRAEVVPESVLGSSAYFGIEAVEAAFGAVELFDAVRRARLRLSELRTLAAIVSGVPLAQLSRSRGSSESAAAVAAYRVRQILKSNGLRSESR
jgi:hypothetical protein